MTMLSADTLMSWAGDEEARARGTQKSVLERKAPPTFPLVIEMRERAYWVTHWVEDSIDCLLHAKVPVVQVTILLSPPNSCHVLTMSNREALIGELHSI